MKRFIAILLIAVLAACMDATVLPVEPSDIEATPPVAYSGPVAIRVITDALRSELGDADRLRLNAALNGQTIQQRRKAVAEGIWKLDADLTAMAASSSNTVPCDATATISDGWSSVEYESEPIFPGLARLAKGFAYTQSSGDSGNINSGGAIHRTYVYGEGGPGLYPGHPKYGDGPDRAEADMTSAGCEKHWTVPTETFQFIEDGNGCFYVYAEGMHQIIVNGVRETRYSAGHWNSCLPREGLTN